MASMRTCTTCNQKYETGFINTCRKKALVPPRDARSRSAGERDVGSESFCYRCIWNEISSRVIARQPTSSPVSWMFALRQAIEAKDRTARSCRCKCFWVARDVEEFFEERDATRNLAWKFA